MSVLTLAENNSQLITSWLLDKQSKITRRQYELNIKPFINFVGCGIVDVKIEDLQQYVRMLELKGNKPSTIKGKLSIALSTSLYH
jgi:integrase/recombinase XerD